MANNVSVGQALRKDVWSALWALDNCQMLALAEKARLYIMRDNEPEEPLTMQGYLCKFKVYENLMILYNSGTISTIIIIKNLGKLAYFQLFYI